VRPQRRSGPSRSAQDEALLATELTGASRPELSRKDPCAVVLAGESDQSLRICLESIFQQTSTAVPLVLVSEASAAELQELLEQAGAGDHALWLAPVTEESPGAGTSALTATVERTLALLSPGDVVLLSEPCRLTPSWLEQLQAAAYADSNTASASALTSAGGPLSLGESGEHAGGLVTLAANLSKQSMRLRPRLSMAVGPCVYLRRDALELVGSLDSRLGLHWALEVDFAQRGVLCGLAHVAADDVVVGRLTPSSCAGADEPPQLLYERYPHLGRPPASAASGVLPRALEAARRPRAQLPVTIDARALDARMTGTQRHILELIRALAATDSVHLRLLVSADTSASNLELLRALPHTELLAIEAIDDDTPRTTVFHRPQQVFGPPDLQLALRLGERIVLNQLDLIAYRNPGYHASSTAWHSYRRVSRQALAAADRVIVFSEHTCGELLSDELAEEDRIRIVAPGLDHPSPPESETRAPLPPSDDEEHPAGFLLCLGTDFRHKNRVFAMRLLAELRESYRWDGRLVLAGTHIPNGSSAELERSFLEARPQLRQAIIDLGPIDEQLKAQMMRRAAAVVYPSVYEGFGLVPFEAALSGVPCLFAAQSSLAELLPAEMAAIVPWNAHESAARAYQLLSDAAARARHVQQLAARARRFTWAGVASATVEIYREAAVAPVREAAAMSRDEVRREQQLRELISAQDALVAQLVEERRHTQQMYDELNAEVGSGLSLIGPNGALPEDLQHALLAFSARPSLSAPLYGAAAGAFRVARAAARGRRRLP
jgi:glycosyltransferase involved in cell wall biosynthesis